MAAPTYDIGEIVYLRESAGVGFLESYQIAMVSRSPDGLSWYYHFNIKTKQAVIMSFGDRITKQVADQLVYTEAELITLCEAAPIVKTVLEQRLAQINALIAAHCS